MFRVGGMSPLSCLSSLFVDILQRNFVHRLTIKALAQIWKNLHDMNDFITLRHLAKKTVKIE